MITVYIELTIAGLDVGPFDLYSDVDAFVTPFETGVSRASLVAGYTSYLVPDATTQIKIQSTGVCENSIIIDISTETTTTTTTIALTTTTTTVTPTTTTTTTEIPSLTYSIPAPICDGNCAKTSGNIKVNGVTQLTWSVWSLFPLNGTISANVGDTIDIEGVCYTSGSGCVDVTPTLEIDINTVQVAYVEDDAITWTFTFTEETLIEIITLCLLPL